jgi:RNA polymerase sigma-70 factor (ECF subfamily)
MLCDVEGFTYDEISKKINCPVGTVKSRLFKARKHLYEKLFTAKEICLI